MNEDGPNYNFAKSLAKNLIQRLKITIPPVKLNSVFKLHKKKILILGEDLGSDDGFCMGLDQIIYNKTQPDTRIRFTIAHELGHILLGHNSGYKIVEFDSKDPNETLANVFAAELLVPLYLLKRESLTLMNLTDLANKYWVSKDMMMWRLNSTGLDIKLGSWD